MSSLFVRIFCVLAIGTPVIFGTPNFVIELGKAKQQREKSLAEAIAPIDRNYVEVLRTMMDKATRAGEIDAASKIKAEIDIYDPKGLGQRVAGSWTMEGKSSQLVFAKNGLFKELWNNTVQEARWKVISGTVVRVEFKGSDRKEYQISDDGKSIKRLGDGFLWLRDE